MIAKLSVNSGIKFTEEVSDNNLPFLNNFINKQGSKIWLNNYSKPRDSKIYVEKQTILLSPMNYTFVENAKIRKAK